MSSSIPSSPSNSSAGSRKRQRDASPEHVPIGVSERSEPWLEDGNVILVSIELKLFRIHRGILASNSTVFKDMFRVKQEDGPFMDGCQVVHLADTEHDLRHVLKALYDRNYFSLQDRQEFAVVAAAARLGKKYEIKALLRQASMLLDKAFPMTLRAFDGVSGQLKGHNMGSTIRLRREDIFEAIILAREVSMPFILPAAFALCSQLFSLRELFEGIDRSDEHGGRSLLGPADLQAFMLGRDRLFGNTLTTIGWTDDDSCQSAGCKVIKRRLRQLIVERAPGAVALCVFPSGRDHLCERCKELGSKAHNRGRSEVWKRLPGMFGLPSWSDLEILRASYV